MKWSKIKSMMVYFLVVMNLFMLAIIAVTARHQSSIPNKVINATVSVLEESGFKIKNDIIPAKYYTLPSYNAQFYSASDLSELFFGKQVAFRTEGNSLVATEGKAVLIVNDNYFSYNSGYDAKEMSSASALKKKLKKLGIDMKGAVYDKKANCFYRMYNKTNLFNMSLEAKLDDDEEICYVKAQWPKELTATERKRTSFIESAMMMKEIFPDGGNVENIELGYLLRPLGGKKFLFSPAWRVNVDGEIKILE